MGPGITRLTVTLSLVAIAAWAEAQTPTQPPGHAHPAPPAAGQPQGSPATPGMMGEHGHMHGGGPGMMGGMPGGMRCPMMGGMLGPLPPASDGKAYGRALALRGEILKAIGEVMMKHGAALEQR